MSHENTDGEFEKTSEEGEGEAKYDLLLLKEKRFFGKTLKCFDEWIERIFLRSRKNWETINQKFL